MLNDVRSRTGRSCRGPGGSHSAVVGTWPISSSNAEIGTRRRAPTPELSGSFQPMSELQHEAAVQAVSRIDCLRRHRRTTSNGPPQCGTRWASVGTTPQQTRALPPVLARYIVTDNVSWIPVKPQRGSVSIPRWSCGRPPSRIEPGAWPPQVSSRGDGRQLFPKGTPWARRSKGLANTPHDNRQHGQAGRAIGGIRR